jgi:hypothetical protein
MRCLGEEVERSDAVMFLLARVLSALRSLVEELVEELVGEVFEVWSRPGASRSVSGWAAHSGVGFRSELRRAQMSAGQRRAGISERHPDVCVSASGSIQMSAAQRWRAQADVCGPAPGGASGGRIRMPACQCRVEPPDVCGSGQAGTSRCLRVSAGRRISERTSRAGRTDIRWGALQLPPARRDYPAAPVSLCFAR